MGDGHEGISWEILNENDIGYKFYFHNNIIVTIAIYDVTVL